MKDFIVLEKLKKYIIFSYALIFIGIFLFLKGDYIYNVLRDIFNELGNYSYNSYYEYSMFYVFTGIFLMTLGGLLSLITNIWILARKWENQKISSIKIIFGVLGIILFQTLSPTIFYFISKYYLKSSNEEYYIQYTKENKNNINESKK